MSENKKSRAVAVDLEIGQTTQRTNKQLLGITEPEPEITEKQVSSFLNMLPSGMRQHFSKSYSSNEHSEVNDAPVELTPPTPLESLDRVVRQCPELSRAINAITVGVASRGFSLVPIKATAAGTAKTDKEDPAKIEKEDLDAFLRHISPNRSFSQVMKITVSNRKRFGFAAWEILRNNFNQPVGVNPIEDGKTLRFCAFDEQIIEVDKAIAVGDRVEIIPEMRRFRRYKQKVKSKYGVAGKVIYFKEFGDPRHLNKDTGLYWSSKGNPPSDFPFATELLLFSVVDSGGEYPEPEWVPILPDALASRAIRVCNLDVLDNSATPPLAIIIEGVDDETIAQKIKDQLEAIKGRTSRSKALIIQAETVTAGSGTAKEAVTPSIRIQPMSDLMSTEGMFLKYLAWLEKSIASALRLPLLLVGNIDSSLNRATAEAALVFAEDQVFSPERQDIEDILNDVLLPEVVLFSKRREGTKGVKYWKFRLGRYTLDQTESFLKLLESAKEVLSLNEKRKIVESIVPETDYAPIADEKADIPLQLQGVVELPNSSRMTQSLKKSISDTIGQPVSKLYWYEPEYSDEDPYAA